MLNQAADFVPYVEFLAILVSRTTNVCEVRNGKLFKTGSADMAANAPPCTTALCTVNVTECRLATKRMPTSRMAPNAAPSHGLVPPGCIASRKREEKRKFPARKESWYIGTIRHGEARQVQKVSRYE